MPSVHDGPRSPQFQSVRIRGNLAVAELARAAVSEGMRGLAGYAPSGSCTGWGIPFEIRKLVLLRDKAVSMPIRPVKAAWLVFMHTTDHEPLDVNVHGFVSPSRGLGLLGECVADYVVVYEDGSERRTTIRRQHQIGMFARRVFGENCFQAVQHHKFFPRQPIYEQPRCRQPATDPLNWFSAQTRVAGGYSQGWMNWLWAWENPCPRKPIVGLRFEPRAGTTLIAAVSAGKASSNPLRWETRRKAILRLPRGVKFESALDGHGLLEQIQLDMGQVISARPRTVYRDEAWSRRSNDQIPTLSEDELLVEYAAHPDAQFHVGDGKTVPVSRLTKGMKSGPLTPITTATQRVLVRVLDKATNRPVPVKLHVHGASGEYLAPVDRHRIPSPVVFEDFGADYVGQDFHCSAYIAGETEIDLPLGKVYVEISKGFEIKPIRKVFTVARSTQTITLKVRKVLPWRERGWVTADTHVHFLSPQTARLEGAAEGVNVVNLLASQWGELITNAADFDGKTTIGSKEAGGDGEWLVRVGSENRQNVLGHISLLGYGGNLIAPMCTGGPEEGALGDPVGALLTDWARRCKRQGGLVVLSHFPHPRAENAAAIVHGDVDAIEMTWLPEVQGGIDPYSLSDWYRYLNGGYFLPAVGGTDKMTAGMAVGALRTYARIPAGRVFDYSAWMEAVRSGDTFVTYGPLLEFMVEGKPPGAWIKMRGTGGAVDVTWEAASVTVPMSRVDLVVNGEIRESKRVKKRGDAGHWTLKVDKSAWIALLIRGHRGDKPEIIAAHSSPVMIEVEGKPFHSAADGVTILEQIEGALAYLDTVGSRAETRQYKRMRMTLTSAHRKLHNRLHAAGVYHGHTPATDHNEHH